MTGLPLSLEGALGSRADALRLVLAVATWLATGVRLMRSIDAYRAERARHRPTVWVH